MPIPKGKMEWNNSGQWYWMIKFLKWPLRIFTFGYWVKNGMAQCNNKWTSGGRKVYNYFCASHHYHGGVLHASIVVMVFHDSFWCSIWSILCWQANNTAWKNTINSFWHNYEKGAWQDPRGAQIERPEASWCHILVGSNNMVNLLMFFMMMVNCFSLVISHMKFLEVLIPTFFG